MRIKKEKEELSLSQRSFKDSISQIKTSVGGLSYRPETGNGPTSNENESICSISAFERLYEKGKLKQKNRSSANLNISFSYQQ